MAFRQQVIFIWNRSLGEYGHHGDFARRVENPGNSRWEKIHADISEAYGVAALNNAAGPAAKCQQSMLLGDTNNVLDLIRVTFRDLEEHSGGPYASIRSGVCAQAISDLNHRFQQHSLGFEYPNGQLIKKSPEYLHAQALKPALSLLTTSGFLGPSDEFLRAHTHFLKGEYQDAILDASNAFESTMKVICGLRGWPFAKTDTASKLIGVMFGNNLIPTYLTSQFDHLRLVLEAGIPTARNKVAGHGHGSTPIIIPEHLAAYALHLAASNIVFLVEAHKAKP